MEKQKQFYFSYIGSKFRETKYLPQNILNECGKSSLIVEPFCGSVGFSNQISRLFPNEQRHFVFSDIDELLIKFYSFVKTEGLDHLIEFYNEHIKHEAKDFHLLLRRKKREELSTEEFFFLNSAARGHMFDYKKDKKELKVISFKHVNTLLNNAEVLQSDYLDIFNQFKGNPNALMYLDPPYFDSFNMNYHMHQQDNSKMLVDIISLLESCQCKVLFIINKCALTEYLFRRWNIGEYNKTYGLTRKRTKHLIIFKD